MVDRKDERLDVMRGNKIVLLEFTALTKNPGYFSVFFFPAEPFPPSLSTTVDAAFRLSALRSARSWTAGDGLAV